MVKSQASSGFRKTRIARIIAFTCSTITLSLFILQATLNKDAPIRKVECDRYIGKYGDAHTEKEYELYRNLNSALFVSAILTFSALFYVTIASPKRNE